MNFLFIFDYLKVRAANFMVLLGRSKFKVLQKFSKFFVNLSILVWFADLKLYQIPRARGTKVAASPTPKFMPKPIYLLLPSV